MMQHRRSISEISQVSYCNIEKSSADPETLSIKEPRIHHKEAPYQRGWLLTVEWPAPHRGIRCWGSQTYRGI
uniref:Uncharacterized protein n=1 Tax=Setaria italica TaxID=4555 RepID=K4AHL9_SETIT